MGLGRVAVNHVDLSNHRPVEADCPHALRSSVKNHFSDLGQEEHREAARPSKSSSRQPLHLKLARATKGLGRPAGVSRKPTAASGSTHIHIKNSHNSVPKYRPLSTPVAPQKSRGVAGDPRVLRDTVSQAPSLDRHRLEVSPPKLTLTHH